MDDGLLGFHNGLCTQEAFRACTYLMARSNLAGLELGLSGSPTLDLRRPLDGAVTVQTPLH